VAESVLSCTSPSSNLRQNLEIRAGRVVRWWASSTPTYATVGQQLDDNFTGWSFILCVNIRSFFFLCMMLYDYCITLFHVIRV